MSKASPKTNGKTADALVLDQRDAKLGNSLATWALHMGKDERVPCKALTIKTTISRKELCSVLREELAATAFFNERADGFSVPLFGKKIGPIKIVGEFVECSVDIFVGIDLRQIALAPVTIGSATFQPVDGGRSELKFTVQFRPEDHDAADVAELEHWLDQDVKLVAAFGKIEAVQERQPELPLNDATDAPNPHDEPDADVPRETVEEQAASDRKVLAEFDAGNISSKEAAQQLKPDRNARRRAARAAAKQQQLNG